MLYYDIYLTSIYTAITAENTNLNPVFYNIFICPYEYNSTLLGSPIPISKVGQYSLPSIFLKMLKNQSQEEYDSSKILWLLEVFPNILKDIVYIKENYIKYLFIISNIIFFKADVIINKYNNSLILANIILNKVVRQSLENKRNYKNLME